MQKYVFIASRDPFDCADIEALTKMANDCAREGNDVTLYFIQNAVLGLRRACKKSFHWGLTNVKMYADDYSLRMRGITEDQLDEEVTVQPISHLVDLLSDGETKIVWH